MIGCNLKKFGIGIALAAATVFTATSASAYTISVGGTSILNEGLTTSVAGATVIDFNSGLILPAGYTGGLVVNGSSDGNWASPPDDTSNYLTVGSSWNQHSPVTITLGSLHQYFGYYGGSPDTYNSIELWHDDSLIQIISGRDLADAAEVPANGDQSKAFYWNIWSDDASEYFNIVKLVSTSNAFETDNHSYLSAVPIPAAAWLFISGVLGLIGFSRYGKTV